MRTSVPSFTIIKMAAPSVPTCFNVRETWSHTRYNVFAQFRHKIASMLSISRSLHDDQLAAVFLKAALTSPVILWVLSSFSFIFCVVLWRVSRSVRLLVVVSFRLTVGFVAMGMIIPGLRNLVVVRVVGRVVGGTNLNLNDEHSTSGTWKDVGLFVGEDGSVPSLARCPT